MEIKRLGSYLDVDADGYLIKTAHESRIQAHWREAVEAIRQAYLTRWGDRIHSVYVRGSVAKGCAVDNVSDLDTFAVMQGDADDSNDAAWEADVEADIGARFPSIAGVELGLVPLADATAREEGYAFITKLESACVYGEDLSNSIKPYRPDAEAAFQTRHFRAHLERFLRNYPQEEERENRDWLVWIMRRFLRLGMELVMEQEQRFTRDLSLCFESFARHYPEKQNEMFHALELAVNPDANQETEGFARDFGGWLAQEADKRLAEWDKVRS